MKHLHVLISLAVLAPAAHSQSVLYTFDGTSAGDQLGISVSGAGDVNGDGSPDMIVGAFSDDSNGLNAGSAQVFSGVDGSVLYTFYGDSAGDLFGRASSGAGDVNGDGFDDLVVGAEGDDGNGQDSGSVRVFSGVDGSVLYTLDGDSPGDWFGFSASGAGDVNGDGYDDLIAGALYNDDNGTNSGSARVISGVDGTTLYTFRGDAQDDLFGFAVGGAGDVDGDGFHDLIVGALYDDNNGPKSGSARVFSGLDGATLYTFDGDSPDDWFGVSVSGAGDVNGDGFGDLIVGAIFDDNNGTDTGSARVFSGVDGGVLYTFDGDSAGDQFGFSVTGAGDVNGDGLDDLIVGAGHNDTGPDPGSARVFSGVDGSTVHTFDGDSPDDWFGVSVSGAGDVNGDGYGDLIVGALYDDNNGPLSGSARVFSGCDAVGSTYCSPAVVNSSGLPAEIHACGSDAAAENRFHLRASQLPAQQFGYFLASQDQGFVQNPGGSQGNLCLGGTVGRFVQQVENSGPDGVFGITVDLTNMPPPAQQTVLPGDNWSFQAWFRDENPHTTSNFTDAVAVTFH